MCLDISFYSALELIDDYFPGLVHDTDIDFDPNLSMHVLAFGYKKYPIVVFENGNYHRKHFEWCIITAYMDTPEKIKIMRPKMANARAEKILDDKRSFWYRIRKNRCVIPLTGIFEHRSVIGWKNKVPYLLQIKNREMFSVPALFYYNKEVPSDPETGEMNGMFSMVTCAANQKMKYIHNDGDNKFRMPLFLPKEKELRWLDPDLTDKEMREILAYKIPSEELIATPVWTIRTTKERPDGKTKVDCFDWPNLPDLGNDDGQIQKALF